MAAIPLNPEKSKTIVAEWRTGEYSQQELAERHKVSKGAVNKLCKGVAQDTAGIVTAGVQYQLGLAAHDDRNVTAVTEAVDEKTKHIQFFTEAAIVNVREAMQTPCDNQRDFKDRADTISKGKETVLGKQPDTAIQINNNPLPASVEDFF